MNKFLLVLSVLVLGVSPAKGVIPVVDTGNIAKAAAMLLEMQKQIENQLRQIREQEQYFARQYQKLKDLGHVDSYKLGEHLKYFADLKKNLDGTLSDYKKLDADFRKIYKSDNGTAQEKIKKWESETENNIYKAMKSHAALGDSARKMQDLDQVVKKQQQAAGDLAAIQALGEITKVLVHQIEELKTIMSLDAQAKQSQMMEAKSKEELMRKHEEHLVSDLRKKETYKKITKLPNLSQGGK